MLRNIAILMLWPSALDLCRNVPIGIWQWMGCPETWSPQMHILMATRISRCKCRAILTIHLPQAVQLQTSWPRCTLHRIENSISQSLKRVSMKSMAHLALPEAKQGWRKSQAAPEQAHAPAHELQRVQPTLWIAKSSLLLEKNLDSDMVRAEPNE